MATYEQLATALRNAHAAGDVEAARKLANALKSMGAGGQRQQPKDGALGYSIDQAQRLGGKGIEAVGNLIGSETVAQAGSNIVAQQDKDIEEGGYRPTYTSSLRETFADQGVSGALGWIGEKTLENAASGGAAIAGAGLAAITAPFSLPAAAVLGGATTVGSGLMGAGGAAFEQEEKTGDYSAASATAIGALTGLLDRFGAGAVIGKIIPKKKLADMTGEELVDTLMKNGYEEAAEGIGRRIARAGITEAGTETAQEGLAVAGAVARGGEYTGREIADRALESAVLGGTMGAGARGGIETVSAAGRGVKTAFESMSQGETLTPEQEQARGDFANRLVRIAEQNGFNLSEVNKMSDTGAVRAVDTAHTEIAEKMKELANTLREQLRVKDTDSEAVANLKTQAATGLRQGRNKTKSVVGQAQFDAIDQLVGETKEGQQLIALLREGNELTTLHNSGYVGGVSQYTDILSPITSGAGYDRGVAFTERLARPLLSTSFAYQTGGASLAAQAAAAGAGRAIDAVTGRRSRVQNFVKDNQGNQTSGPATGRSIRAQRKAEIERLKAIAKAERERKKAEAEAETRRKAEEEIQNRRMNREMFKDGTRQRQGYTPDSPQDVLLAGTGLDLAGILEALKLITSPQYTAAARSARRSLEEGGTIKQLSDLIRVVNDAVDNSGGSIVRVRDKDTGAIGRVVAQGPTDPRSMGIAANRAFAQSLIDAVSQRTDLPSDVVADIVSTLETLKNDDLGSDPVARAEKELDKLLAKIAETASQGNVEASSAAAGEFVGQYIDRIKDQQAAAKKKGKKKPAPKKKKPEPEPKPTLKPEPSDPILTEPERDGGNNVGLPIEPTEPTGSPVDPEGTGSNPEGDGNQTASPEREKAKTKAEGVIFQIGKAGTPYENGIDTLDAARTLVEALGVKFVLHDTHESIVKSKGGKVRPNKQLNGYYNALTNAVHVLGPDVKDLTISSYRTMLNAISTALHEAGHAMDLTDRGIFIVGKEQALGRKRDMNDGRFEMRLLELLRNARGSKPTTRDVEHPIVKEIIDLQRHAFLSLGTNRLEPLDLDRVREPYTRVSPSSAKQVEASYFHQPVELIADALMMYMMDPKRFKEVAPNTAAFLREVNNADPDLRKVITLHSAPIGAIMAALSGLFLAQSNDEDEEPQSDGLLTMGKGALSA